jgi:hypothetical protein
MKGHYKSWFNIKTVHWFIAASYKSRWGISLTNHDVNSYKTLKLKVSSYFLQFKTKTQVHSLNLSHTLKFHRTSYRNVSLQRYRRDGISTSGIHWRHLQMRRGSERKKQLQTNNLSLRWKKPETLQLQLWAEKYNSSFKKVLPGFWHIKINRITVSAMSQLSLILKHDFLAWSASMTVKFMRLLCLIFTWGRVHVGCKSYCRYSMTRIWA